MNFCSLRYLISVSIISIAGSVHASDDFAQCFDVASLEDEADFDFDFNWVQRKKSVSQGLFDDIAAKAIVELSERLSTIGPRLVVAIEPIPLAGAPTLSAVLQEKSKGWRAEYRRKITELRELGILSPDLSVIYDNGRTAEDIQRTYDHHLTGRGAWLSGAAIAAELNGTPESFEDYATQLNDLEKQSIVYSPSDFVYGLMLEGCDPKDFKTDDFVYTSQESGDSESLFGDATEAGAILVGDSYSTLPEFSLGNGIDEFYTGTVENFGVAAGGHQTSLSVVLATQFQKLTASDWLVWQVDRDGLHSNVLLGTLMLVKGAELGSCDADSFLLSEGNIVLDENGIADLPILGVLEDSLTLHVSGDSSDKLTLTYHLYDGTSHDAFIDRRLARARFLEEPIQDIRLGLVGNDWFGEENRVRSISIKYEAEGAAVSEIGYTACWTRDGQH